MDHALTISRQFDILPSLWTLGCASIHEHVTCFDNQVPTIGKLTPFACIGQSKRPSWLQEVRTPKLARSSRH